MFIKIISSENEDKVIGTIVIFHTGNIMLYEWINIINLGSFTVLGVKSLRDVKKARKILNFLLQNFKNWILWSKHKKY